MSSKRHQTGAALVIAISIMTILLAIALTFFALTRVELQTATNVAHSVRADHLADAAVAMAVHMLNEDFERNPGATSTDHAWRSFFSGAAFAGKPWAMRNGQPLAEGSIPQIGMMEPVWVRFDDGHIEQLYLGERTRPWLFIPRAEGNARVMYENVVRVDPANPQIVLPWPFPVVLFDRNNPPRFVTSDIYGTNPLGVTGYPAEQVHRWADMDNNGDGLRDSIWIPIPADVFLPDDGIDNNLNGFIDEPPAPSGISVEAGVFVYNGCCDGLDNNGNGLVDEPSENKLFLTASLPGIWIPVDLNGDGIPDTVPTWENGQAVPRPLLVRVPDRIDVPYVPPVDEFGNVFPDNPAAYSAPWKVGDGYRRLDADDVDVLDNDYDMFVNNFNTYAYVGPNRNPGITISSEVAEHFHDVLPGNYAPPYRLTGFVVLPSLVKPRVNPDAINQRSGEDYSTWRPLWEWNAADADLFSEQIAAAYTDININSAMGGYGGLEYQPASIVYAYAPDLGIFAPISIRTVDLLGNSLRITHSGEPVCELAGRAAILIIDEASKVNLNIAGAHVWAPFNDDGTVAATPNLWRALGDGAGPWEYETRMIPQLGRVRVRNLWGLLMGSPDGRAFGDAPVAGMPYQYDVSLPGYGRVDDSGTALLAALTGAPNYLRLPNTNPNRNLRDPDTIYSELPPIDLELPPIDLLGLFKGIDDPQELRRFNPRRNLIAERDGVDNNNSGVADETGELGDRQLQNIEQIRQANQIGPEIFSDMRPFATVFSTDRNVDFLRDSAGVIRAVNQLDYNQATAQQIAAHLIRHGGFVPFFRLPGVFIGVAEAVEFAYGLRQHDTIRAPQDGVLRFGEAGPAADTLPGDPQLAALRAAVTVVDARDADHARTELTTPRDDRIAWNSKYAPWPTEFSLRERVAEDSIFPAEEIEAHLNALGVNLNVDNEDDWWARFVESDQTDRDGKVLPEGRRFQHTVAGIESIRINEMMVRPVRRIEAEMNDGNINFNPAPYPGMLDFILKVKQTAWDGAAYMLPYAVNDTSAPWYRASRPLAWDKSTEPYTPMIFENVLGDRSVLQNGHLLYQEELSGVLRTIAPAFPSTSDPIEFIFEESKGLPAGRYYLKINTIDEFGTATVNGGGQLQYVIKYVNTAAVEPLILQDVISGVLTNSEWLSVPSAHIGGRPGEPEGWVFLDGTAIDPPNVDDPADPLYPYRNYFRDGGPLEAGKPPGLGRRTHTVYVPPAGSGYALCVALRRVDGGPLAVNFFDFSQEPDHEWIEITNISDEPVDLSGWELEVGIPDPPNVNELVDPPLDTFKSRWRVPDGTRIAPKGYLLLGFDSVGQRGQIANAKFDRYKTDAALFDTNLINANGIGLAAGAIAPGEPLIPDISGVTVPPIADTSATAWTSDHAFYDFTGSVFRRDYGDHYRDYVDNHGDGISAQHTKVLTRLRRLSRSSSDPLLAEAAQLKWDQFRQEEELVSTRNDGPVAVTPRGSKPWDRIVALQNLQLWRENPLDPKSRPVTLDDITTVDMVARVVLRGGALPNYPERDGIDNDGDGAYLEWGFVPHPDPDIGGSLDLTGDGNPDRVPTRYVPGILDRDMIDNDLNGMVDERGVGVPRNLQYYINEYAGDLPHNPFLSEGVDEGRPNAFRRYGPGSYEPGTLPAVFFNSRAAYPTRDEYYGYGAFYSPPGSPSDFLTYDNYTDDPDNEHVNPTFFAEFMATPDESRVIIGQFDMLYAMQPGRKYLVTFQIDAWAPMAIDPANPPSVRVRLGDIDGVGNTGLRRAGNGVFREVLTCQVRETADFHIIAAPGTQCIITGISVRPVQGPKGIDGNTAFINGRAARLGDPSDPRNLALGLTHDARYLGTDEDPLEWKVFAERRWNPGDNVIVTLYEGPAEHGRVADRVTYREYDVINRTVDDVVPSPYHIDGYWTLWRDDPDLTHVGLHPDYPRLWLPDHMGLDFYRSLERKHPLYAGDRFGTANRWTPTNGNYDDWADSMSIFANAVYPRLPLQRIFDYEDRPAYRFAHDEVQRLLRHGLFASPLRMNFMARIAENPPDLLRVYEDIRRNDGDRPYAQFLAHDEPRFVFEESEDPIRPNQDWAIARVLFPNAPIETGGIALLPFFSRTQTLFNTARVFPPFDDTTKSVSRRFVQSADNPNMVFYQGATPTGPLLEFQATNLRGALLALQEEATAEVWQELARSATQDSVVLSVAEAKYTPIRPDRRYVASSPSLNELLQWRLEGSVWRAPALWAPVYLFELPGDDTQAGLPPFPDGFSQPGVVFDLRYFFDADYLFNTARLFGQMTPAQIAERWPLARRAAMYVSEARIGVEGQGNEPVAPEALFTWDAETGLENGDYYLYVSTFIPGMREQLQNVSDMLWQDSDDFVRKALLKEDSPAEPFRPVLALEVITDPTQAQGLGGAAGMAGLTPPSVWVPPTRYEARPDGLIPYGDIGSGTWMPRTIRVTNNFLALRVRNVGAPGDVAALTHIVLTPRKRTPGRININTAENHLVEIGRIGSAGHRYEFFNPIMGLPGVVRALESVRDPITGNIIGDAISPADDIELPSAPVTSPWPAPSEFAGGRAVPPTRNLTVDGIPSDLLADRPQDVGIAAMRLAAQIMAGRPKHKDGRYYESIADLLNKKSEEYDDIYPLSNEDDPEERFNQVMRRFRQIVNLVTVRSDVFEIIATVQAGYGVDLSGDGVINYRSNEEFITTAETKTRLVYERRAPAARADEAAVR